MTCLRDLRLLLAPKRSTKAGGNGCDLSNWIWAEDVNTKQKLIFMIEFSRASPWHAGDVCTFGWRVIWEDIARRAKKAIGFNENSSCVSDCSNSLYKFTELAFDWNAISAKVVSLFPAQITWAGKKTSFAGFLKGFHFSFVHQSFYFNSYSLHETYNETRCKILPNPQRLAPKTSLKEAFLFFEIRLQ